MTPEHILRLFESHPYPVIGCTIAASVGLAQCFFGAVVSLVTAIGTRRYFWAVSILFLGPVTALPFTLKYGEADYPKKLMTWGLSLMGLAAAGFALLLLVF